MKIYAIRVTIEELDRRARAFPGAGPSFIVLIFVSFFFRLARRYTSSVQSDMIARKNAQRVSAQAKKGGFLGYLRFDPHFLFLTL